MFEIEFYLSEGSETAIRCSISMNTDQEIERARVHVENLLRHPLPVDDQTGFPSFTVFDEDGEEIRGG